VARPARRRQPLPAHDPRAVRGALRREIYEFGDSLRFLDDIEFVVVEREGRGPAIKPIVNGIDLVEAIEHVPVPAASCVWHYSGLDDAGGRRDGVPFTWGPLPASSGPCATLGIAVGGRYVRWTLGDELGNAVLVFDRATYRERLTAALEATSDREPTHLRLLRDFYERTPWEGPFEMGLEDPVVVWPPCIRRIRFLDPFWHAEVIVLVGDPEQPLDEYLAGATRTIAQWNTETLGGQWSGPVRPPHYPLHWTRLEAS